MKTRGNILVIDDEEAILDSLRLNLTQSAVSHQIKSLEEELGEPLFIRGKRGVSVSQAGKIALEHAANILDEADILRARISELRREP